MLGRGLVLFFGLDRRCTVGGGATGGIFGGRLFCRSLGSAQIWVWYKRRRGEVFVVIMDGKGDILLKLRGA